MNHIKALVLLAYKSGQKKNEKCPKNALKMP